MAETFEAVRRGPGSFEQRVCVKRILPAYETDREFVSAFMREATTGAQLRHANIAQVLDFGVEDGCHYLALELVDGLDLRSLAQRAGPLPADLVTLIAIDLASALAYAHTREGTRPSVVHRDISPSNVLLSLAGEVKLVDFGIAKALDGTQLTSTGVIKGKVPYLPPEYIEHASFDARGDLFSLGVTLFEVSAGQRPFDGASDFDTIRRITTGSRRGLCELRPDVPADLASCIERILAVDPRERFDSAASLLEALPVISVPAARRKLAGMVRALVEPRASEQREDAQPKRERIPTRRLVEAAAEPGPMPKPVTHTAPSPQARKLLLFSTGCLAATLLLIATVQRPFHPEDKKRAPRTQQVQPVEADRAPTAAFRKEALPSPTPKLAVPAVPEVIQPPKAETQLPPSGNTSHRRRRESATASHSESAELQVVAIPFGDVWIDGQALGHAPVTMDVPTGSHEIAVGDGRPAQRRTVRLSAGEVQKLTFRVDVE